MPEFPGPIVAPYGGTRSHRDATYRGLDLRQNPKNRQNSGPWSRPASIPREKDDMAAAGEPFDKREGVIWYDGHLVPWENATLHVLTHGLHYASCVFEGERAYGGEIYRCTEHSERLKH